MLPSQPFDHQERSSKESQFSLRMNTVDPPPLPLLYNLLKSMVLVSLVTCLETRLACLGLFLYFT